MRRFFALFIVVAALIATWAVVHLGTAPVGSEHPQVSANPGTSSEGTASHFQSKVSRVARSNSPPAHPAEALVRSFSEAMPLAGKADRLAQVREEFRELAKGDPSTALRAARQLTDDNERETALLELVTQWRQGDLSNPRVRAQAIESYGIEAGLGLELAKDPALALLWANELTPEGPGRTALLQRTAVTMVDTDPASAFALSDQLTASEREGFQAGVFAGWAEKDTEAALQWADQLPEASQREAAVQAIRSVAPVGIGTAIMVKDGYAVINGLLPGTPAESSGQIGPGDRIIAIAQGDNAFVDARGVPLRDVVEMIRGAPGTTVQLQLLGADAPADAAPRTVSIVRGQIKFKQ